MNTMRDVEMNQLRDLTADEIETVAGGSVVGSVSRAIGQVAGAIGDALGSLVGSSFPIKVDLSGAAKAGAAIGKGAKGPQ